MVASMQLRLRIIRLVGLYLFHEYRSAPRALLRRCITLFGLSVILVFLGSLMPSRRISTLLPYQEAAYDQIAELADTDPRVRNVLEHSSSPAGNRVSYVLALRPRFVAYEDREAAVTLYLIDTASPTDTWFAPERLLAGSPVLSDASAGLTVGLDWHTAQQLSARPGDTITIGFVPRGVSQQQAQGHPFTLQATVRGIYGPTRLGSPGTIIAPFSSEWQSFVEGSYAAGRWGEMRPSASLLLRGEEWRTSSPSSIAAALGLQPHAVRTLTSRHTEIQALQAAFEKQGIEGTKMILTLLGMAMLAYFAILLHEVNITLRQRSRNFAILTALGAPTRLDVILTSIEFLALAILACSLAALLNKYVLYERMIDFYFPPGLLVPVVGLGAVFNALTLSLVLIGLYLRSLRVPIQHFLTQQQ